MKKIFALALAALMTAGMTTVAFADTTAEVNLAKKTETGMFVDDNDDGKFASGEERYDVKASDPVKFTKPDGGKKVALPLWDKAGNYIDDKDAIKGYKVKATWTVGDWTRSLRSSWLRWMALYMLCCNLHLPDAD